MLAKRTADHGFPSLWPFEGMLDEFWSSLPLAPRMEGFVPNLDVTEDDEGLTIVAELPGLSQNDVQVEVDGNVLTIRGEKQEQVEKKERTYHRVERRYGAFTRQVQLPGSADTECVSASHKDGVLTVRVPKKPEAKKKSVKIDVR